MKYMFFWYPFLKLRQSINHSKVDVQLRDMKLNKGCLPHKFIGYFYVHGTNPEIEDPTKINVHNLDIIICLLDFRS